MYLLQRHALPIQANLQASLVLAYALPAAVLRPLLPPGLMLDTFGDLGFVAIAMVETRDLRPGGWPPGWGLNFFLSGYRIFTRYRSRAGRSLRGLFILRSDTNRRLMQLFGNWLTHYRYDHSVCKVERTEQRYEIRVKTPNGRADLQVEADLTTEGAALPSDSPFPNLIEARKFAGPLPFTFDYERQTHSIIRVEGMRQRWTPLPVAVRVQQNTFFEHGPFRTVAATLASAFFLENVPYAWRPGIREVLP